MTDQTSTLCPRCATPVRSGARFCRSCGADLESAPAPAPIAELAPAPTTPVAAPRHRWWRSRRLQLIVGGGLVAVLLGSYGIVAAVAAANPPTGPVHELFDALADRDAARAGALAGCEPTSLCEPGALQNGYEPPELVAVGATTYGDPTDKTRRPNRNRATVAVRYRVAGAEHADTVGLTRTGSGLVRDWQITTAPGAVLDVISTTADTAQLAGADVDTVAVAPAGGRTSGAARPLPGVYTLTTKDTPLLAPVTARVVIAGDLGRQETTLTAPVKPAALAAVTEQIRTRIDTCARVADLRPDLDAAPLSNCPFEATTQYTIIDRVRWSVLAYPRVELRQDDAGAVSVHTTTPGRARVTYRYSFDVIEPRTYATTTATADITIAGSVVLTGGTVTWTG